MVKKRRSAEDNFQAIEKFTPRDDKEIALVEAIAGITDCDLMGSFLRDLMTPAEIAEFANRFEVARLLTEGHSYQEVANLTKVSTTTVTRVAHWLFNGCGGYHTVLKKKK